MRHNHARELLLKAQESALNLLVRWCLLDSSYRLGRVHLGRGAARAGAARAARHRSQEACKRANLSQIIKRNQDRIARQTHSRLLFQDVQRLRKRDPAAFLRYFFWRWLTCVNVVELLLVLLLAGLCAYQCYELLEDYYNYPTHLIVTNVMNDDFRIDLPAVTLCDNNQLSKSRLREDFAELNTTHFLAMSHGRFYSATNFTLREGISESERLDLFKQENWYESPYELQPSRNSDVLAGAYNDDQTTEANGTDSRPLDERDINWVKVTRKLTRARPAGFYDVVPKNLFVDSLVCATISGDKIPCDQLRTIPSIQEKTICHTFFHDSVLWDPSEPAVADLERHLRRHPILLNFGNEGSNPEALLEFEPGEESREQLEEELDERLNEERMRLDMDNKEIIRIRVNFSAHDYANPRVLVGGRLTVHSSSTLGEITHKSSRIEPGNWYIYYVERSDYQRLPAPYSTNCHDYNSNRYVWRARRALMDKNTDHYLKLIARQTNASRMLPEYADFLRKRTMGKVSRSHYSFPTLQLHGRRRRRRRSHSGAPRRRLRASLRLGRVKPPRAQLSGLYALLAH